MLPFELTKDTPYLALSGELWSVFYEYFTEIDRVIKGFYCTCHGTITAHGSDIRILKTNLVDSLKPRDPYMHMTHMCFGELCQH